MRTNKDTTPSNRRKEWRLVLPLPVLVKGCLPNGKKFTEKTILENISSDGAYFALDATLLIDTKLSLIIELPSKLAEGKNLKLCLEGNIVRLEKQYKEEKKQGVAIKFNEEFKEEEIQFITKENN